MKYKNHHTIISIFLILIISIVSSLIVFGESRKKENSIDLIHKNIQVNLDNLSFVEFNPTITKNIDILYSAILTPYPTLTPTPTPTATPTPTPTPTPIPKTPKKVLGFTTYYSKYDVSSLNTLNSHKDIIDEIASATHNIDEFGNITGVVPYEQIKLATENNIIPLVLLCNQFSGKISNGMLQSVNNRNNCIKKLIEVMKSNGYKGVNIDFEGVYASDREQYTCFIKELYNTLKPLGYMVTVSVPGKTADNPKDSWNGCYDYSAISNYVDQLLIMTYDEHYKGGEPGPIASIGWVTKVIDYSLSVVPKEKIFLGVAAYGYDWNENGGKSLSISECFNTANKFGAKILWDYVSKTPYFTYIDENKSQHNVWFEDLHSIEYKLNLVNTKDIGGIGIWRLGIENTDYMNMIKTKLKK